ncbi:MAG: hypothetical protein ACRDOA_01515 [Streptosporangiaceae bacterium]
MVARLGETGYPEAYGGLTAHLTGSGAITMTLYVVAARAEPFVAAVRDQAARNPAAEYTVVHVPHTWAKLTALAQEIEDARGQWRARGVHIGTADPDAAASKVIITLANHHPAAASALRASYGDDWISVVSSSARYIPLAAETGGARLSPP